MEKLNEDDNIFLKIDGIYYTKDLKMLVKCQETRTGKVKIPEGVEIIKNYAFQNSEIESVIMPDSLKNIQQYAFKDCYRLHHVEFGHGITEIGKSSQANMQFCGCKNLKVIEIPAQIKKIYRQTFSFLNLDELVLHEGLEDINSFAFSCCHIKELSLPASLKHFGQGNSENVKIFHLKTVPCDFILEIVKEDEYGWLDDKKANETIFTIDLNGKRIFIPSIMEYSVRKKVNLIFNEGNLRDTIINNMFQYAMTEAVKLEIAFRIYCEAKRNGKRLKNIETMLKPCAYSMITNYLSKNMLLEATMMINCGFLNQNEINTLKEQTDDVTIRAYLLQAAKNNPETTLHI